MRDDYNVRLDKRAVVLAIAAVGVAVILGYWAGATQGIAAALAGLFSAAVLQVAFNRQNAAGARRARLAAADASFAPAVIAGPSAGMPQGEETWGGVARYLRPEAEVVRFWPRPELDELVQWAISDEGLSVRLVVGAGGSGKTRLARQLSETLTDLGWVLWWVPAGAELDAVKAGRESDPPVVLVADYAETRTNLPDMLAAAVGGPRKANLRLLLLARSVGEWWQHVQDGCPDGVSDLIAASAPITLGPVASTSSRSYSRGMTA